ncbi:MAG: hypothetical protein ACI955_000530 [Zhongshania sp.]|jgi:hypothetical protein
MKELSASEAGCKLYVLLFAEGDWERDQAK